MGWCVLDEVVGEEVLHYAGAFCGCVESDAAVVFGGWFEKYGGVEKDV